MVNLVLCLKSFVFVMVNSLEYMIVVLLSFAWHELQRAPHHQCCCLVLTKLQGTSAEGHPLYGVVCLQSIDVCFVFPRSRLSKQKEKKWQILFYSRFIPYGP